MHGLRGHLAWLSLAILLLATGKGAHAAEAVELVETPRQKR